MPHSPKAFGVETGEHADEWVVAGDAIAPGLERAETAFLGGCRQRRRRRGADAGRITRRGPSLLRGMLVEVAWVVWRHNDWAKAFVGKVSRGMRQRKEVAIVALARRLLVKLWAMLRTNTPWRDPGGAGGGGVGVPAVT